MPVFRRFVSTGKKWSQKCAQDNRCRECNARGIAGSGGKLCTSLYTDHAVNHATILWSCTKKWAKEKREAELFYARAASVALGAHKIKEKLVVRVGGLFDPGIMLIFAKFISPVNHCNYETMWRQIRSDGSNRFVRNVLNYYVITKHRKNGEKYFTVLLKMEKNWT